MKSAAGRIIKNTAVFAAPLLLFAVLLVPFSKLKFGLIVDWLGCGCQPGFNANRFTTLFWSLISVCAAVISVFLSKKIPKEKMWLRLIYIAGIIVLSLLISDMFCKMMLSK